MVGDGEVAERNYGSEEREWGSIPYLGFFGIEAWIKLFIDLDIYIYIMKRERRQQGSSVAWQRAGRFLFRCLLDFYIIN